VASDQLAYGGATSTRAVEPFAGWLRAYQRVAYLRGALLALVLLTGLAGIARAARGRAGRGGPGLFPWLASVTLLLVPVMTADYSERYVLIAAPAACLAAGLAFARTAPARPAPSPGEAAGEAAASAALTAGLPPATGAAPVSGTVPTSAEPHGA
jgi:hypothetical protein